MAVGLLKKSPIVHSIVSRSAGGASEVIKAWRPISWRFPNDELLWDGKNPGFTNNEKANEYVKPRFRKGWELKDITL